MYSIKFCLTVILLTYNFKLKKKKKITYTNNLFSYLPVTLNK